MTNAPAPRGFSAYLQPRILTMLALGFSSGLPFPLVAITFAYWLRDEGTSLAAIGFISWVGLAYSFKFLWAPFLDRTSVPLLARLGRRRSWMALTQIIVSGGLMAMSMLSVRYGLVALGAAALVVAFASATQDIAIDAWRIESAEGADDLGLLTSGYTFGYRVALLATDSLILFLPDRIGWAGSYFTFGVAMVIGLAATFFAAEPLRADKAAAQLAPLWKLRGAYDAVAGPFIVFFKANGTLAIVILTAITLYTLPNFVMSPLANPLYHDIGLTKDQVGLIRSIPGTIAAFAGVAAGGFASLRLGYMRTLLLGGILQAFAVAAFALLSFSGPNLFVFGSVMFMDNFSIAFAGIALVTYMSSLTRSGYVATQYALLSSSYTWAGKILKGFSGLVVDSITPGLGLLNAYAVFFIGAGLIGIPALLLFVLLERRKREQQSVSPA